ncbi:MAG: RuBisCO large subunit C-terminal-like domain-containing protein [Xanthobacteraceae bacterium]
MPLAAISDDFVRNEIVGRVEAIHEVEPGTFEVAVSLAMATVDDDPGQLLNILFGNSSLHDDIVLWDVDLPPALGLSLGGPRHGVQGLRARAGAGVRALSCSALKPQGLPAAALADLAARFAQGGIDYIKDDHGLADQAYSPFAARVNAVAARLRSVKRSGAPAQYAPSLSGDLASMQRQIACAVDAGIETVLIAPMVAGLANFHRLVRDHPGVAFIAHPSMAGAARIAPPCLLGKLFRVVGADAVVFPNHGGRFGYSPETCRTLAQAALAEHAGLRPCMPVPAGGMTRDRVPEMLEFYGPDVMLLIGGNLLEAREHLVEATAAFVAEVHGYKYGQ